MRWYSFLSSILNWTTVFLFQKCHNNSSLFYMVSLCDLEYLNIYIFYIWIVKSPLSTISQQTLPTLEGENINNITPISRPKLSSMQEFKCVLSPYFIQYVNEGGKKIKRTFTAQIFTRSCKYLIDENWNLPFFETF